jgi:sugar/nucleoside kinase (ribokinase family)
MRLYLYGDSYFDIVNVDNDRIYTAFGGIGNILHHFSDQMDITVDTYVGNDNFGTTIDNIIAKKTFQSCVGKRQQYTTTTTYIQVNTIESSKELKDIKSGTYCNNITPYFNVSDHDWFHIMYLDNMKTFHKNKKFKNFKGSVSADVCSENWWLNENVLHSLYNIDYLFASSENADLEVISKLANKYNTVFILHNPEGSDIYYKDEKYSVKVKDSVYQINPLGAGDILCGCFIYFMHKAEDEDLLDRIAFSLMNAHVETTNALKERKNEQEIIISSNRW